MALTGELEHLHIVDIIQLINTARKSGTLSVRGSRGEIRFVFSNGSIVDASHLSNRIRIGNVLLKLKAVGREDLERAAEIRKSGGGESKTLLDTLIGLGILKREDAARALRKLIEMALVELVGWTKGTFTLDTDGVIAECGSPAGRMAPEITVDAQMILMDALRVFDERERDRQAGKTVPTDEEEYADVISHEEDGQPSEEAAVLTADDLGLEDLDRLERKMPRDFPPVELFDPSEIHRQKIKDLLADSSSEERDSFVLFLERFSRGRGAYDMAQRQEGRAIGLVLFSKDEFLRHSVMTICKDEGVLVFAAEGEEELDRMIVQCLAAKVQPVAVFDSPGAGEKQFSRETISSLRQKVKGKYPRVPVIQLTPVQDYPFMLEALRDNTRTVFPKPSREERRATFIPDTITFLETFKAYISGIFDQQRLSAADNRLSRLREQVSALRELDSPAEVSLALLRAVSEQCERAISFIVRGEELTGDRAVGVYDDKNAGPTSVTRLKVSLAKPSVFREAAEKKTFFCGEGRDETVEKLFEAIGAPLSPTVVLLPVMSNGKTVMLIYGDSGAKEAASLQGDALEILAHEAGLVLENLLCRKQPVKTQKK